MQTVEFLSGSGLEPRKYLPWMHRLEQDLVLMGLDTYRLTRVQARRIVKLLDALDCKIAYEDEVLDLFLYLTDSLEGREPPNNPTRVVLN